MAKREKLEEPEVIARVRDYRQTFGTQSGRRVLGDLRKSFGKRSSFVANDPHMTSFREGERNVVLKIESMLNMTEEQLNSWTENIKFNQTLEDSPDA